MLTNSSCMKRLFPVLFILLLGCDQEEKTNPAVHQLDEYLKGMQKHFRFNGNVLVAEKGNIVLQRSYGYANYDDQRSLNDSSVFELASVSKQFTATGILLLKDRGQLQLSDSLRKYFPELPYHGITIQHMLTHTSGLPDYFWPLVEKWDRKKIAFNEDVIAFLAKEKMPLQFEPGKKWEYSNTAYMILASIIEKVSGQSFAVFMAKNIFHPLGMSHSLIYNTRRSLKDTLPNYAYGYAYHDSLKKYILPDSLPDWSFVIYMDGMQGDGTVNSTTGDLLKWDRAVKNHALLQEATQKEMLKGQSIVDTTKNSTYGYGVFMEKNDFGNIVSHGGGWPGYNTFLARNIEKDQTYIILSNNNSPSSGIANALQHIMAGKQVETPYEHKAIVSDSASLAVFTGDYDALSKIKIVQKGSRLFRVTPSGNEVELRQESPTKFFYNDESNRQIEFELDSNKKVKKAWIIILGVKTELKKL